MNIRPVNFVAVAATVSCLALSACGSSSSTSSPPSLVHVLRRGV